MTLNPVIAKSNGTNADYTLHPVRTLMYTIGLGNWPFDMLLMSNLASESKVYTINGLPYIGLISGGFDLYNGGVIFLCVADKIPTLDQYIIGISEKSTSFHYLSKVNQHLIKTYDVNSDYMPGDSGNGLDNYVIIRKYLDYPDDSDIISFKHYNDGQLLLNVDGHWFYDNSESALNRYTVVSDRYYAGSAVSIFQTPAERSPVSFQLFVEGDIVVLLSYHSAKVAVASHSEGDESYRFGNRGLEKLDYVNLYYPEDKSQIKADRDFTSIDESNDGIQDPRIVSGRGKYCNTTDNRINVLLTSFRFKVVDPSEQFTYLQPMKVNHYSISKDVTSDELDIEPEPTYYEIDMNRLFALSPVVMDMGRPIDIAITENAIWILGLHTVVRYDLEKDEYSYDVLMKDNKFTGTMDTVYDEDYFTSLAGLEMLTDGNTVYACFDVVVYDEASEHDTHMVFVNEYDDSRL
jgi:hypothetical protein